MTTNILTEEITETKVINNDPNASVAALYVGDLDPNVTEAQLLELFKPYGTVLGVRICRDILDRHSLGYGYINYQTTAEAERAIESLNFKKVGNKQIRIMFQQRDPYTRHSGAGNVFVKNLDEKIDSSALFELFKQFGKVLTCKVMSNDDGSSRRYGFVHFKEDNAASEAITKMNGSKDEAGTDEALYVAQFIRRNARIAEMMMNFTNVYIKQVLPNVDRETIEKFFSKFGGITSAITKTDSNHRVFGFCNFERHESAAKCIEALHDKCIEGLTPDDQPIYIQRAQPRSERLIELRKKYTTRVSQGNNLYVRNFSPEFTDDDLLHLFEGYGEIQSCKVMTDEKGNSRCFGFVSFATPEQANTALREMNHRPVNEKPLVVNIAQRRDQRFQMLQAQFQQRIQRSLMHVQGMQQQLHQQQHYQKPQQTQIARQPRPAVPQPPQTTAPKDTPKYTVSRTPLISPSIAPETPPLAPISREEFEAMPADERRNAIGERLFVKVAAIIPDLAPKITGMFLQMAPEETYEILENKPVLDAKVNEAICVIHAHHQIRQ